MTLIRLLSLVLVIWLIWRMIQNYQSQKSRRAGPGGSQALSSEKMVKCEYCALHLPEKKALSHEGHWFCNKEHKARFLASKES